MVIIPCLLECRYQCDGLCMLKTAAEIHCTDGKCPYFSIRENKNAADAKSTGSGSNL
ncbi:MAG: hypothetical protein ACI396_05750 [Acutalibacteraceae bacterium]